MGRGHNVNDIDNVSNESWNNDIDNVRGSRLDYD